MSYSLGILEIFIICVVVVLWAWGVVDLLKRELSRPVFTKWLTIIIAMPIVGFILYLWLGKHSRRGT
jgi:threonine/homoserine/homoserine lactone efflux protein